MERAKNVRRIIPFKKFGIVRVNNGNSADVPYMYISVTKFPPKYIFFHHQTLNVQARCLQANIYKYINT